MNSIVLPDNLKPDSQLAILNGASLIGRVVPNFIADKLGTFNMLIPFSAFTGILILILLAVHTPAGFVIFAVFYGIFSGSCKYSEQRGDSDFFSDSQDL